jgi:GntR family transcriptional regulator, transcriptional repressor for pyruvate dehydrogenase complex
MNEAPRDSQDPRAFIQVADELREEILSGGLPPDDRLPSETELCSRFAVSRSTVREALRVLTAQGLVQTQRGATGGSRVVRVNHEDVSKMLRLSIRALTVSAGVTETEMDEVRELLEVAATWYAASRRTPQDLTLLFETIPANLDSLGVPQRMAMHKEFHAQILRCAGNRMIHLLADPVSILVEGYVHQHERPRHFWKSVTEEHRRIADAIEMRDPYAARLAMSEHLANLRTYLRGLPARSHLEGLEFHLMPPGAPATTVVERLRR